MPRIEVPNLSRTLVRISAAAIVILAAVAASPGAARADFDISGFDTFICPTDIAPAPPGQCAGTSAPAGAHRASTVSFDFSGTDHVNNIIQHFPVGIIPNPENVAKCPAAMFNATPPTCPPDSQLGTTNLGAIAEAIPGLPLPVSLTGNVYNLEVDAPYVGGLGFITNLGPLPVAGLAAPFTVRTGESNVPILTDTLPNGELDFNSPPVLPHDSDDGLTGISAGVPDNVEGIPIQITHIDYTLNGTNTNAGPLLGKPYISLSTGCLTGKAEVEADSHENPYPPGSRKDSAFSGVGTTNGCNGTHPPFNPTLAAPTLGTTQSDTPSSYDISVAGLDDDPTPGGEEDLHESDLRKAVVTLPEGTSLSPSAANGLQACTDAQLGQGNNVDPTCPAASDIGDIEVETNNLPASAQPTGQVYLGKPVAPDTYRLFLAFEIVDGLWVKQKGVAKPDPNTGRITTTFDNLPALPFTEVKLKLKRPNGTPLLVNPATCGSHTVESTLTPWRSAPSFTASVSRSSNFSTTGCVNPKPFVPTGNLMTTSTQAGVNTPLSMDLDVPDRHQILKTLELALPPGLVGSLTNIPVCSASDASAGACGEQTRVGSVTASVGSGPSPLSLPGSIYLTEPFQGGDPAGLAIVIAAKAGPFDFGQTVTRARVILRNDGSLKVALVDNLPRIIEGIPIRVRTVNANVDRDNFIKNPTSCAPLETKGSFTSLEDGKAESSSPFQMTGCEALPFGPKLQFIAGGETKRFGHPSLKAVVTQSPGEANIARSSVYLPDVLRPETVTLNKPGVLCQGAQADLRACPPTSQVGTAKAVTPLLPQPLSGPIFIVQEPGNPLPRLVVHLDGMASIRLDAQNSISGVRTLNVFDAVPDVPLTSFELNINGGANGILKNFNDLCSAISAGDATFTAHSGKTSNSKPQLETPACAKSSSASPRVSIKLRRVAGRRPVLKMSVKKGKTGTNLRKLSISLPRSLRANPRKRAGIVVKKGARKLAKSKWKLTKSKLTFRKIPKAGLSSISVQLKKGAVTSSASLARKVSGKHKKRKTKVVFKVNAADIAGHNFKLKPKVRARR